MNNIFEVYPALSCFAGALLTLVIAFSVSSHRSLISCKRTLIIIALEIFLAFMLLKTNFGNALLTQLIRATQAISDAAHEGIAFVFGSLGTPTAPWGFVFALHVLPIIIFFSALIAVLSHLGVINFFIQSLSYVVRPVLGTSSAETTNALAKSFLGPTEAQLLVRDYLFTISTAEMFAVMVSGLSMISASLFAVYVDMGIPGNHLIAANFMGIFGSLLFAKIIMPSDPKAAEVKFKSESIEESKPKNSIEALIRGTLEGLQLVLAIGALLISFMAVIALLNTIFIYIGSFFGITTFTFQDLMGYIFAPFGFLLGLPTAEAFAVSELIGIKLIANEMVAFAEVTGKHFSDRGLALATYAICGFANIACVGIVIGGISTIVPKRRSELSSLAGRALLAATLSNLFSAYIVGILL